MATVTRLKNTELQPTAKRKVAAYARVSENTDSLLNSLSNQVSHFSSLIQSNPEWEYVGVYVDEGITGTKIAPRYEFERLIEDCKAGKIDIVLTKTVSRFARDTVDCLSVTRMLKTIGVEVRFEREGISSFSHEGELMLTLAASFAQAESESISTNIKWTIRNKFKEGIPNGHIPPFGYRWDADEDKYVIIPKEGEIVKKIYKRYLEGTSIHQIRNELEDSGVIGKAGVPLASSTVRNILTSESYIGTLVLQKRFAAGVRTIKRNDGELPMYKVSGMYEPLVSTDDFSKVQKEILRRAEENPSAHYIPTKFSGLMRCGYCGGSVVRRTRKNTKIWQCSAKERKGTEFCDLKLLTETELEAAATKAVGNISYDEFKKKVQKITVYGDRIDFHLSNGRIKTIQREFTGKRGKNPFTNKIYCAKCGSQCERNNSTKGTGLKVWKCPSCGGFGLKEPDLINACISFLGKNYAGHVVEHIEKINITRNTAEFIYKGGETKSWKKE